MIKRIFFEVPIVILAFLAVLGDLMASKSAKIDFLDAFLSKGENKIFWVFNFSDLQCKLIFQIEKVHYLLDN